MTSPPILHTVLVDDSALSQAITVRDGLRQKRDNAVLQLATLEEERKQLSFEAHTAGGEAAKQLAKLNRTRLELLGDIETYEAALLEAERRIKAAERDEEIAAVAGRAERALSIGAELLERAQKIDAALAVVAEESKALDTLICEVNINCKCPAPNRFQLESLGTRDVNTALMFSPFKLEHMAPRDEDAHKKDPSKTVTMHFEKIYCSDESLRRQDISERNVAKAGYPPIEETRPMIKLAPSVINHTKFKCRTARSPPESRDPGRPKRERGRRQT